MRGKLYLRSVRNFSDVPQNTKIYNIARKDIKGLEKLIELAPSQDLFYWYLNNRNKDCWFDLYKVEYSKEIKNKEESIKTLKQIQKKLNNGINICFVCFCSDKVKCHRSIIGNWYRKKGFEVDFK